MRTTANDQLRSIADTEQPHSVPIPRPGLALAAALLGFFVITLDAVVVNVALPSIRSDLSAGMTGLQWVVDGYTLMFAALLLSAGALSDRIGARRAFGVGLALFVVASVACGLAPSLGALVVARFVQGAAAAVMMPSSMALIGQAYPDPTWRARAVAMWAMGGAVASSSGPVLGGLLTLISWRMIFSINLPVGAVALLLLARTARSPHHTVPFDWVGQVTAVLAMGGLTYGAIEAGASGFAAPQVVAAFTLAALALAAFVVAQARGAHPMVPLDLFQSRNVSVAMAVGFAFMVGYYGLPFVMSLYLQQLRGLSSLSTGLAFLPMMLIGAALTPFSARHGAARRASGHHQRSAADGDRPGEPRRSPARDTRLGAGCADGPGRGVRPADLAARHRRFVEQRSGLPRRHGQRRIQHEPADRRRAGGGGVRRIARPASHLHAGTAHQPADRRRGCAHDGSGQPGAAIRPAGSMCVSLTDHGMLLSTRKETNQ